MTRAPLTSAPDVNDAPQREARNTVAMSFAK